MSNLIYTVSQRNPNFADPIPIIFCLTASAAKPGLTVQLLSAGSALLSPFSLLSAVSAFRLTR